MDLPRIDAPDGGLDKEQRDAFAKAGLMVVSGLISPDELAALRADTARLVDRAVARLDVNDDFCYRPTDDGSPAVPYRIEHLADKAPSCRVVLGHPGILRIVESVQGPDFFPPYDTMVFTLAGGRRSLLWHRDSATRGHLPVPFFNVGVYLDDAEETNCMWAVPGSTAWRAEKAARVMDRANASGELPVHAVSVLLRAGDVLLHDVRVVHAAPHSAVTLRRALYFEFRPAWFETTFGPHTHAFVTLRQGMLHACLRARRDAPYTADEDRYEYQRE